MNAVQLLLPDNRPSGVWFCQKCRIVSTLEHAANACCAAPKCNTCGKEHDRKHYTICRPCEAIKDAAKEVKRFDDAEKVTEWDGPVYSEDYEYNNNYTSSLGEMLDYFTDRKEDEPEFEIPKYVWACDSVSFISVDVGRVLESATQEAYEDFETTDLRGVKELEAAVDAFNEANKGLVSWHPNYKKAVLIQTQDQSK